MSTLQVAPDIFPNILKYYLKSSSFGPYLMTSLELFNRYDNCTMVLIYVISLPMPSCISCYISYFKFTTSNVNYHYQVIVLNILVKGCLFHIFASSFIFLKESTCETFLWNTFYFTAKAIFILEIIKFELFKYSNVIKCLSMKNEIYFTD